MTLEDDVAFVPRNRLVSSPSLPSLPPSLPPSLHPSLHPSLSPSLSLSSFPLLSAIQGDSVPYFMDCLDRVGQLVRRNKWGGYVALLDEKQTSLHCLFHLVQTLYYLSVRQMCRVLCISAPPLSRVSQQCFRNEINRWKSYTHYIYLYRSGAYECLKIHIKCGLKCDSTQYGYTSPTLLLAVTVHKLLILYLYNYVYRGNVAKTLLLCELYA